MGRPFFTPSPTLEEGWGWGVEGLFLQGLSQGWISQSVCRSAPWSTLRVSLWCNHISQSGEGFWPQSLPGSDEDEDGDESPDGGRSLSDQPQPAAFIYLKIKINCPTETSTASKDSGLRCSSSAGIQKSRSSSDSLVIKVHVHTMTKGKDISSGLRQAAVYTTI